MTYDYLPGELPNGWTETKSIWLDAFQCGTSEVRAPQQNGSFSIKSSRWSPNFEGKILSAGGHGRLFPYSCRNQMKADMGLVHDGGVEVDVEMAVDKSLCKVRFQACSQKRLIILHDH